MNKGGWKHLNKMWWMVLFISIVSVTATLLTQMVYKFIGYTIDYGLNYTGKNYSGALNFLFDGRLGEYGSYKLTVWLSVIMFVIVAVEALLKYYLSYLQMKAQYTGSHYIRKDVFYKIKNKKAPYSQGSMVNLYLDDLYQHGSVYFYQIPGIVVTIVTTIFCLLLLNQISPLLLIAPIGLSPLLIYFSIKYHKEIYDKNLSYREMDGELKNSVDNALFSDDVEKFDEFKRVNKRHTKERKIVSHVPNKYNLILNAIKVVIYMTCCTIAGVLAIKGKVLIGEYLIFTKFVNTIYTQILSFISYLINIRAALPKLQKVDKILEVGNE